MQNPLENQADRLSRNPSEEGISPDAEMAMENQIAQLGQSLSPISQPAENKTESEDDNPHMNDGSATAGQPSTRDLQKQVPERVNAQNQKVNRPRLANGRKKAAGLLADVATKGGINWKSVAKVGLPLGSGIGGGIIGLFLS